ncbi:PhzF family phenazine biosynthesis protein [Marivirga sp. S37H4]|uniref:PhzF family phenazine biosynthesis protein n=1 Tax=Marivirga aurantiaca TaxID=2802615 RepID=A0A934X0K0_9BACT|nr:PhzF family phenazine biosynthesis protein [Marivirga aurantiaca]MBK6266242.1 PhzF family phenazine biosynthesis protein [Marivirga aurantiaca]
MKNFSFSITNVFSNLDMNLRGNPSAVILLDEELDRKTMQRIGKDLHQPATTFLWPTDQHNTFNIRWFAPDAEIGLCGHGSLAAIAFLTQLITQKTNTQPFKLISPKGVILGSKKNSNEYEINLEAISSTKLSSAPKGLEEALGQKIVEYHSSQNKHIVVLENEQNVAEMDPNFKLLQAIDVFGYAVTAPSEKFSFVSRTIVPHVQQLEDHATGSSHALLVPYWAEKLDIDNMVSVQLSPRGGYFSSSYKDKIVKLMGQAYNSVEGTFLL